MKLKLAISATLLKHAASDSGLVGAPNLDAPECPPGQPCPRHIASARDMIHDLAELGDSPLGLFAHKPAPDKVVPRDMIRNHGCYCYYEGCSGESECRLVTKGIAPRVSDYQGVEYKTKLDKMCHQMHKSHTCLQQEMGDCQNMRQNYRWKIADGAIECTHKKNTACQVALCEIDKEFAEKVVTQARADQEEVRHWYFGGFRYDSIDDYEASCPRPNNGPRSPINKEDGECCGLGLERAFYRRIPLASDCCQETDAQGNVFAETVRPIGMC